MDPVTSRREAIILTTIWTTVYFVVVARGLLEISNLISESIFNSVNGSLCTLGLGLTLYFWLYDVVSPGFKRKYPSESWLSNAMGVFVAIALFFLFTFDNDPIVFLLFTGLAYFMKGIWHHISKKDILQTLGQTLESDLECNVLRCALLTNAVAATIISIYVVLAVIFEASIDTKVLPLLCASTVITLEVHYQLLERMIKALSTFSISVESVQTTNPRRRRSREGNAR